MLKKRSLFKKLKKIGCKFQLNLLSLTDYYGADIRKMSEYLLKSNLIDYFGSDIHSLRHINCINGEINNGKKTKKIKVKIKDIDIVNTIFEKNNFFC